MVPEWTAQELLSSRLNPAEAARGLAPRRLDLQGADWGLLYVHLDKQETPELEVMEAAEENDQEIMAHPRQKKTEVLSTDLQHQSVLPEKHPARAERCWAPQ